MTTICGPSKEEKNLEKQEASFDQTLQQDYSQTFAQNQQILSTLNQVLQPIVTAGPNQEGFNLQEKSALNTQAIESNAAGYNAAISAAEQRENAAGGGTSFLPSGVNAQINAEIGSEAEANKANELLDITKADYAQGRANWQTALAGEQGVASGQNPLGYAGATTNANEAAFNEADKIQQETNQAYGDVLSGIGSIATGAIGGFANLDRTGGSTFGEQLLNFGEGL